MNAKKCKDIRRLLRAKKESGDRGKYKSMKKLIKSGVAV